MMSLDQKSDIKRLMAFFFFFCSCTFLLAIVKLMSRNSHFGCLLILGVRSCRAAPAAASKGKKGRSRNYYNNYLVPAGKHPDFQSLLALA